MDDQHTPGPWFALGHTIHRDAKDLSQIVAIASCHVRRQGSLRISAMEAAANARLIAAAPDLLAALKEYQSANRIHHDDEARLYELGRAAIVKAETL